MDSRKPSAIFTSPLFIASVLLLLVNDHVLKQAYPGLVTGKLSDVAGLFAVGIFFSALVPGRRAFVHIATAIGFVLWKIPASDIIIETLNAYLPFTIGRTVDYSDLWALLILPAGYAYIPFAMEGSRRMEWRHTRTCRYAMALIAGLSFCASVTIPILPVKQYDFRASEKEISAYIDSVFTHHPELRTSDSGHVIPPGGPRFFFCRLVDSSGPEIFVIGYLELYPPPRPEPWTTLYINHVHPEGAPDEGRRKLDPTEQARLVAKFEREFLPKLEVYVRNLPYR